MRRLVSIASALLVAAACGLQACGSQVVLFPEDASVKPDVTGGSKGSGGTNGSPIEAGMEAEATVEATIEATVEATVEATMEATMEATIEATVEATIDAPLCIPGNTLPVGLGTAGDFAVLAKSGIASVPLSIITGDIGVSPIAASAITGFALTPCTGVCPFSTSTQVTGNVYAADYGPPTPVKMTTAIGDMGTAITDASGRAADFTELGSGNIGSLTLAPGVYKWSTGVTIPTDVTLKGGCGDVFIFEIAQGLTMAAAKNVILSGGVLAKNVFWQVTGSVDIGANSHFEGDILCATAITMETGSSVNGSLLAQTAVNLQQATVVKQ
jgi:hypothetical protein